MSHVSKTAGPCLLVSILLLSLNLRPAIAAVGPLVQAISAHTGVASVGIALLTAIPVFMMGLGAVFAAALRQGLGERLGIALGAMVIALACGLRWWGHEAYQLWASALLVGMGIAVIQALLPGFIKRNFGTQTSRVIALYSTGIVVGAALGSGSAAWLQDRLGWRLALAIWAVPAALAAAAWLLASRRSAHQGRSRLSASAPSAAFWRLARSWSLMLFFGIGTGAFMLAMAWVAPFYIGQGMGTGEAGLMLSLLTVVEALTALWLAWAINRFADRRGLLLAALLLMALGFLLLWLAPRSAPYFTVSLLGLGIGIVFPMSIIVAMDHLQDATGAGNFTAFVQGGGFLIAAAVPLLAGVLRDAPAGLSLVWLLMALASLAMGALAMRFSQASYVRFQQQLQCLPPR